ncbi:MAG: hypothetical protein GX267_07845 [Fibrobacter sp.]|jgi:hypothetical protein|nr:hypothetical protein [Fibrobacter sp.]
MRRKEWTLVLQRLITITVLLSIFSACGMPSVSDLVVVAGPRGLAISITSDCASNTHIQKKNGSSISILIRGCAYKENSVNFNQFQSDAALERFSLRNRKEGVELNITLRTPADSIIRSQLKGNTWIALLSSKPFAQSKWSLSDLNYTQKENPVQQTDRQSLSSANLKNIRLFNRDNTCELFFDFNADVDCDIQRKEDTLLIRFNNAGSEIDSTFFVLPEGTVFKSIKLDEAKAGNKRLLWARVILNRKAVDSSFNILSKTGQGLSLYAALKNERKAVLWNSLDGMELGYDFYKMPVYEVDMKSIERQIQIDRSMPFAQNLLFSIQEKKTDVAAQRAPQPLEGMPQEKGEQESSYLSSAITTMQQVQTDTVTQLRVNLGSEIPLPLNNELSGAGLADTIFKGSLKNMIRYNRKGRDPFLPYISSVESDLGLPFVENLRLVGILYDNRDRIGLLEDKKNNNRPFTLREEDRVEKGKVLKIYRDRIVFLITEYGISRSVTLRLTSTSSHQEVGIR